MKDKYPWSQKQSTKDEQSIEKQCSETFSIDLKYDSIFDYIIVKLDMDMLRMGCSRDRSLDVLAVMAIISIVAGIAVMVLNTAIIIWPGFMTWLNSLI